jgi:hypothetical protein
MSDNGGNEITVADVLNTFHHLLYRHVTDDHALDQMYVVLEAIEQHMIVVEEMLTAAVEQRDELAHRNDGLTKDMAKIIQSIVDWRNPSHPKVAEMVDEIGQEMWEESEPDMIAYAHENTRDEMIEALANAISDKYSTRDASRVAQKMADLLLDMPDVDYSDEVRDILKMLAEAMDDVDE